MYTHYTTTKNKQQFNSIWLNLQHTHIALCCKGTWVTYMKKEVLLVKKKNTTAWSPLITYTVHLSVRLRVNRGRKIKPELTFYVQTATRFHGAWLTMCLALNWGYIKKTIFDHCKAITTLYTRVCLLQKPYYCQSSHTARSCKPQQNTRPILPTEIRLGEVLYSSIRHTCLNKKGYNLLVSCSSHCSNDLVGCWHYMNTQTVILDSEFSWVQLCFVWHTDQTIWGTSVFNIVLT